MDSNYNKSNEALLKRAQMASRLAEYLGYYFFQNFGDRYGDENIKKIHAAENNEYSKYAFSIYQFLANQGDTLGIENLASMYQKGKGVEQSTNIAASYYKKIAEKGSKTAMVALGEIYATEWANNDYSVEPPNFIEAEKWYQKAASLGSKVALYQLGKIYGSYRSNQYLKGKDKEKYAKAIEYYTLSANLGYKDAMQALAIGYEFGGEGFKKDKKLAKEWEAKANAVKHEYGDN